MRCSEAEDFARAVIHFIGHEIQLFLRDAPKVMVLGKVLAQKAVGILVGATLPGGIGTRKKERRLQGARHPGMVGEFLAVVRGQAVDRPAGIAQCTDQAVGHRSGVLAVHLLHHEVARLAVHDRHQGGLVAGAEHGVDLEISAATALVGHGWAMFDADPADDLSPLAIDPVTPAAAQLAAQVHP